MGWKSLVKENRGTYAYIIEATSMIQQLPKHLV